MTPDEIAEELREALIDLRSEEPMLTLSAAARIVRLLEDVIALLEGLRVH